MTKRSLAALAASLLMSVAAIDGLVAPQLAYAQASGATATSDASTQAAASTQAPAAAESAPPPAPAATEAVENPYGLGALWKNGDFVARFVLILLVIMSMGSWYIMITKFVEQLRANRRAKLADAQLWSAPSLAEGAKLLDEASPFRFIAETAIEAGEHHDEALLEAVDRNTWIDVSVERSITNVSNRMQDGLAFLATVGSTAPFVGLFGTVWGIYHALTAIGIAGQASIDKVAGPVGEALIMTAIGLAVAVPAVLGYNFLVRRNKSVMERVRNFGAQLHTVLLAGSKRPARVPSAAASLVN
ncbi:MotA/TolQ/ExbB proton channel family protein [Burkholderia sp. MS389]|uniref:MotA/TolQ/ExbB proton channel family protein n=1 Tax=unclassified Burkholderia TaxID=2613784 RepID=UPI000F5A02D4|nr:MULTISPECIES: MotA/TolQ/ExbB proton channel family protein [unclassified Burkholderia]RQU34709.1 MotA/TolQ/ExbB proton channel family protein [Burkholderia cenocepacia]QRR13506.1 MotA/TolQ/ExbB proton channel family protein [Burkholderia sp. MS389]QVN09834.1 MotA/TolQ/ExbB proton channel family protein [Burkholderia sp. LAS2]RQU89102.1 MotA/TolQ/ExbB proton channel family protein [Burkholderia cenocepacia]RQV22984.1 MotA/TolQ/ExbB proton channel family protein [Burkholderia cenocepacia]